MSHENMGNRRIELYISLLLFLILKLESLGQPIPSREENIDFINTFSKDAESQWGDDDHIQIFFFLIPKEYQNPFYVRIFDPDCGGEHDLNVDGFNSRTSFSMYGGYETYSNPAARSHQKTEGYDSGRKLINFEFGNDAELDNQWFSLGPFNPKSGEFIDQFNGNIFKLIIEGETGNDGNLYRLFLSSEPNSNKAILGSNAFTYNYSFRLKNDSSTAAHLYPFIDNKTVSIKQGNFDFDNEGTIKLYSRNKNGHKVALSGDDELAISNHPILPNEQGKTLDIQIVKNENRVNDMSFFLLNQYNEAIPFFAIPLGGIPQYEFKVKTKYEYRNKKHSF